MEMKSTSPNGPTRIAPEYIYADGRLARGARLMLALLIERIADESRIPLGELVALEDDLMINWPLPKQLAQALFRLGARIENWEPRYDNRLGVRPSRGFISDYHLIEAGRGLLKWRRSKFSEMAGFPATAWPRSPVLPGVLSPEVISASYRALYAAGCWRPANPANGGIYLAPSLWRTKTGGDMVFSHRQARRWE